MKTPVSWNFKVDPSFHEAPPAYAATLLRLDLQWLHLSQLGLMKDTDRNCSQLSRLVVK